MNIRITSIKVSVPQFDIKILKSFVSFHIAFEEQAANSGNHNSSKAARTYLISISK